VGFIGLAYFESAAIAGRYLLAFLAQDLVQAAITFRAVARRERTGLDLYLDGEQVYAHRRSLPLDQRRRAVTLHSLSGGSVVDPR
jgi:hypothetical protein